MKRFFDVPKKLVQYGTSERQIAEDRTESQGRTFHSSAGILQFGKNQKGQTKNLIELISRQTPTLREYVPPPGDRPPDRRLRSIFEPLLHSGCQNRPRSNVKSAFAKLFWKSRSAKLLALILLHYWPPIVLFVRPVLHSLH